MAPRRWLTLPAALLVLAGGVACAGDPGDETPTVAEQRGADERGSALRPPGVGADVPQVLARAAGEPPQRATSARRVAVQILAAENAIADPTTTPRVLAAAGHLQQVAYRTLGDTPRWDDAVRSALPKRLRRVVRDNVASRREFGALQGGVLSDTVPAWRIVEPEPARTLLSHYREAARRFGVDWEYLAAINLVETGMGRIRGTSVAGAQGPMQFIPSTWAAFGRGDIDDPRDAILAAGRYLAHHGFARRGGKPDALFRYNNSGAYVRGVTRLAEVMKRRPSAFGGYYHWQIYYRSTAGDVLLPEGYAATRPIKARRYLARQG